MIRLNDREYRLVLLDTNALSEFSKHGESLRRFLEWSFGSPAFVPCFSPFSILELRREDDVYERFKELFGVVPSILVKSHEQLLEEEVRSYPDPSSINPMSVAFSILGGEGGNLDHVLNTAFSEQSIRDQEEYWNDSRESIVEGIASLVANYPPDNGEAYGPAEARLFIEIVGFSQIAMRQGDFAKQAAEAEQPVVIDAFPSVKATTYVVWHKFYADRNRKWERQDAYDIMIASAIPYVDAVITESHMAESLRKTQRMDDFMNDVEIYTLRHFRN